MQTIIYLIRHTEAEKNPKTINENLLLSHYGEDCAEKLAKCEEFKNLDAIYSSSYMRAKETAEYIAYENNIEVMVDEAFDERKIDNRQEVINSWKGKPYSYTVGQMLDENLKDENGESRKEVTLRFEKGFENVLKENSGKKVVIVSHGAAIKYFMMNYCTLNKDHDLEYNGKLFITKKFDFPNIIKFVFSGNELKDLSCINVESK